MQPSSAKRPTHTMRTLIAFLVAPLVVPLIMAVYAMYMVHVEINRPGWHTLDTGAVLQAIAWVAFFPAIYAYVGVILFGVPAYRFLTARKLTAFWIAPVVGFLSGGTVMLPMFGAIPAVLIGGPLGAVVGTVLWLIDRPDRRTP